MNTRSAGIAGGLLGVLLLSGCAGDTAPRTVAVQDGAGTTAVEGTLCEEVTAAELTEWTGRPQELGPAVVQGSLTDCQTAFDELGMIVEWGFTSDVDPFAQTGRRSDYPGLTRTRISLAPGSPAWLLTGTIANTRHARVVVNVDGRRLIVDANDRGGVVAQVELAELESAARALATDYVS